MTLTLIIIGVLVVLAAARYGIRCVVSPFTTRGRRRFPFWLRSWWAGERAQNRAADWT